MYEIVDFIHLVPPVREERVISDQGDTQFVYRNAPKKPQLHTVTVEDWCLANTRIMDTMMNTHTLTGSTLRDYMCHTMKICELFKHYQRPSVLQYDREYRHLQARHGFRWGTDCPHLHTLHLRLKTSAVTTEYNQRQQRRGHTGAGTTSTDDRVCYQYNSRQGCSYGANCKYRHACSEAGCSAAHTRIQHQTSVTTSGSQSR